MCDSMVAVSSATSAGVVLFGKNSDREYDEAQFLELIPAARHETGARVRLTYQEINQARETHAALLSKPHWIWGAEIGANAYGLVIGNQALFSKIEASAEDGIIGMDYVRLALERAKDVEEGISTIITLLREHGQGGNCGYRQKMAYHNSFILADPSGAKVLETVDREWVVTGVKDYYAISNAMTIGSEFEASSLTLTARAIQAGIYENGAPFALDAVFADQTKVASGNHRRGRAMKLLRARSGSLQPVDFFGILRDHKEGQPLSGRLTGPRICAHTRESPLIETTASWVATIASGKAVHWVTGTGAPCTGVFKPVLIECGLPEHGPAPRGEPDAVSLWWRHEELRRGLDEGDQDARAAFNSERDDLEEYFLHRMASCPPVTDGTSRTEARRIVEACWREALAFEARWHELVCTHKCITGVNAPGR